LRRDRQRAGRTFWIEFQNLMCQKNAPQTYRGSANFLAFLQTGDNISHCYVSSKQLYKASTCWNKRSEKGMYHIHITRWRLVIMNFIVTLSGNISYYVTTTASLTQFINSSRTHSDLMSTVCIKLILISTWCVNCM
jgi:hypothetical protein